jgi:hypothetical protein
MTVKELKALISKGGVGEDFTAMLRYNGVNLVPTTSQVVRDLTKNTSRQSVVITLETQNGN